MKRFVLVLVFCSGLLSQKGLSEKLESQEQLLKVKKFNLENETYIQKSPVFEDTFIDNAGCKCTNGKCVKEGDNEVCKCPPGFGNLTSTSCKACGCGPDSNCMWTTGWNGYKICLCKPGYGDKSGKCVACNCGPDSNCTFTDPEIFKPIVKDCICKPGYADQNGKCVGPCSKNPCKNGGTCKDEKDGYECVCPTNYSGKDCTVKAIPCSSNPCKNGGKCTDSEKSFICACEKPYSGRTCETSPCSKQPCQNGGTCRVGKVGYICNCKPPYQKPKCESTPCSSNPCQNNGTCNVDGESYRCKCKTPFSGTNCETELSTTTIPPTQTTMSSTTKTVPPVSSTKTITATSPLMSTSQVFTVITAHNFTEEFNLTTYEPSNFTADFNLTTLEPSNVTADFNETTYEPFNFTYDFNLTTDGPANFTYDVNMTSYEPSNITNEKNTSETTPFLFTTTTPSTTVTTKIPDICTINPCQNGGICILQGTSFLCYCRNPHFGKLCERIAETSSPEITTDTSNLTSPTQDTSSPINMTDSSNLTTTFFPSTVADICNDDVCVHGKCEINGRYYRCRCFEGFTGLRCEDRIQNKSDKQIFWQITQTSIMIFGLILLSGVFCILLRWRK